MHSVTTMNMQGDNREYELKMYDLIHFTCVCQHDDGYIDDRSQIKVQTNEQTQVYSSWFSLTITHPASRSIVMITVNKM